MTSLVVATPGQLDRHYNSIFSPHRALPSFLSRAPTDEEVRKHVLPLLGKEWGSFCTYLGVKFSDIQKAMMNNPGNVDEAMFASIKKWLNGIPNRPVTWEFLLKALEEAELKEPSKELKAKLTIIYQKGIFELFELTLGSV